jgi:hypothetical protein
MSIFVSRNKICRAFNMVSKFSEVPTKEGIVSDRYAFYDNFPSHSPLLDRESFLFSSVSSINNISLELLLPAGYD